MADGGGQEVPREVPSVALDRLFLELHDQLPKDARGKLAQLADEVKRLAESSTTEDPVTPSSSADQAVIRREEEIATAEAKQSSGELQARGAVVASLSDQPTLKDVVCFAVPRIAPKWYDLGLALDVKPFVLDTIFQEQTCPDQPRTMLVKWLEGCPGTGSQSRTWQSVLDAVGTICGSAAVEDIRTAVQTPRIPTAGDLEESKTTEHSSAKDLSRKCRRSSTISSDDLALQQSVSKKSLPDYTAIKMDLLAQDISDLRFGSDPEVIIKLLYGNALATISDLLEPHLKVVKKAAGRYNRLGVHHVAVGEDIIESADSIDSLMSRMSIGGMWDQTHFLRKAIASISHSAPERGIAEAVLTHYHLHLDIYERTKLLKDALTEKSESEEEVEASSEANKLVPLEITSSKAFDSYSCEDCHILQVQVLKKAYGIPDEKIICRGVKERKSTTVTFMIPRQYIHDVIQHSGQLDTVWILLELDIIEVSIPGVLTFTPSVGCFLSLLRGSTPFTADLLGVTEVLPYQTYCLLDPNTKEPLSGRPLSTKRIEQHWDSHGALVPDLHGPVPESGDIEIPDTHSEEAVIPPKGSDVSATDEWQSKVGELEDKVKDLERKVANLFMDNVALKTKLEASREVERQQYEEIARLKERLVQALKAQDTATQEQSLSRTRESELKEEIKVLEESRSDLEAEVEKLEKQMKQLETLPSDSEQFAKDTATQEQSLPRTRGSELKEEVRSDLEAEVEKLEKQRKQLETLPSDIEQFAKSAVPGQVTGGPNAVEQLARIREEASKGSSGETSAVPGQVTGGPTAATRGSQPPTQVSGRPPVVEAAGLGQLSTVRKLLDSGTAFVEDRDEGGRTALLWASVRGHLSVVRELVNVYKADVFQKDKGWDMNAMHFAAAGGHIEVIRFLLPLFGARVHEKDVNSYTMLHWAAWGGHCQVARYLIEEVQMDPQDREKWGNTALLRAAHGGSVPLVRALLEEYGSTLDEVDVDGQNAMHKAAAGGHLDVIRFLFPMFGARVHEKDADSYTVLHWAAQNGHRQVARYLIETLNMDLQDRDKYGRTAVLLAAACGRLALVRELVEQHKADLLHKSNNGWNALHKASYIGHLDLVKYLLPRFGQHRFDKTNAGRTCLDLAVEKEKHNVVEYLHQEGGFSDRQ